MDIIQLPILPALTGLQEAWSIMKKSQRSAVVIRHRGKLRIVSACEIITGMQDKKDTLDDVKGKPLTAITYSKKSGARSEPLENLVSELALNSLYKTDKMLGRKVRRNSQLGRRHRQFTGSKAIEKRLGSLLGKSKASFGLVEVDLGSAFILSRHETVMEPYASSPKRCYCNNPHFPHSHDRGRTGDPCNLCSHTLVCKR